MDIERNHYRKNYHRAGQVFFLLSVLFAFLFVLAGSATAEGKPEPASPPTVVSHMPERNASLVPVNGAISVVWDRPMHPETNFKITGPEGFLSGVFFYDPETYTVSFIPEDNLKPDTRYGVLVAGQIDATGQVQQETYQWNFDTVSPTSVSLVYFGSGEEGLEQNWWWLSWPALMAVVSILSLSGVVIIWGRRRSVV